MAETLLSDEVWRRLDHSSTRLSRRDRKALLLVVVLAAVVLALAVVASLSGVVRPRLSSNDQFSERTGRALVETFSVHNNDWSAETIDSVGPATAGTRVVSLEPRRLVVPAGQAGVLTVRVTITDCVAFGHADDERLTLRLDRWWGTANAKIALPIAGASSAC